jgi:hypothetical protein
MCEEQKLNNAWIDGFSRRFRHTKNIKNMDYDLKAKPNSFLGSVHKSWHYAWFCLDFVGEQRSKRALRKVLSDV